MHLDHDLIHVLQTVRTRVGKPLRIVSGYRCVQHNAAVGGSRHSQHLVGRAADVPAGYAGVRLWRTAGAVGMGVRAGRVVHVDVRPGVLPFVFED